MSAVGDQHCLSRGTCLSRTIMMLGLVLGAALPGRIEAQERATGITIASWSFANAPVTARYWGRAQADVVALRDIDEPEAVEKIFPRARYSIHTTSARLGKRTGFAIRNGIDYTPHADVAHLALTEAEAPALAAAADITVHLHGASIRLLAVQLYPGCTDRQVYLRGESCALLRKQAIAVAGWVATRIGTDTPFIVLGDFGRVLSEDDEVWRLISLGDSADLHRMPRHLMSVCKDDQLEWRMDYVVLGRLAREWVMGVRGNRLVPYTGSMCPHLFALSPEGARSAGPLSAEGTKPREGPGQRPRRAESRGP